MGGIRYSFPVGTRSIFLGAFDVSFRECMSFFWGVRFNKNHPKRVLRMMVSFFCFLFKDV